MSVFLPDRLELVTGAPALRRAHLDQVVAALRPARAATRRAYAAALGQRNALVAAIRAGRAGRASLPAWDAELARHGVALMADRAAVVDDLRPRFAAHAELLGLAGDPEIAYRPRSKATTAEELAAELAERVESDLERGFTGHGPHRDDLALRRDGRELRAYGSRGQQRLGLLALLLAEREALAEARGAPPLMLLDDVMSELDAGRRARLVDAAARRRSEPDHDDRPRARAGRRGCRRRRGWRSPRAPSCGRPREAARPAPARRSRSTAWPTGSPPRRCSRRSSGRGPRPPAAAFAGQCTPDAERDGVVTVACSSRGLGAGARPAVGAGRRAPQRAPRAARGAGLRPQARPARA